MSPEKSDKDDQNLDALSIINKGPGGLGPVPTRQLVSLSGPVGDVDANFCSAMTIR